MRKKQNGTEYHSYRVFGIDAKSYIDYAMSVIIARALPDVRDGLKPVQRRTLTICMNWESAMTNRIVRVHVLSEIPWVNIIRMEILPSMMRWLLWHRISKRAAAGRRTWKFRLHRRGWRRCHAIHRGTSAESNTGSVSGGSGQNVVDFMPNFDETEKNRLFYQSRCRTF